MVMGLKAVKPAQLDDRFSSGRVFIGFVLFCLGRQARREPAAADPAYLSTCRGRVPCASRGLFPSWGRFCPPSSNTLRLRSALGEEGGAKMALSKLFIDGGACRCRGSAFMGPSVDDDPRARACIGSLCICRTSSASLSESSCCSLSLSDSLRLENCCRGRAA